MLSKRVHGNLSVYEMEGTPQDEPFKSKWLMKENRESAYIVMSDPSDPKPATSKQPDGWWDFVIPLEEPSRLYLRRERQEADKRYRKKIKHHTGDGAQAEQWKAKLGTVAGRGHSSIAKLGPVLYCGSILFGGSKLTKKTHKGVEAGFMIRWENKSGHYKPGQECRLNEAQTRSHAERQTQTVRAKDGTPLLPIEYFVMWDGEI
jgi:hypothetical protein